MKTLKMLALVVAITFSSAISASTIPVKDAEPKTVRETVIDLLKYPNFVFKNDIEANVLFTINNENEFVVLKVESDNEDVKKFIKDRLNYKKVTNAYASKFYTIPVKIEVNG